MAAAIGIGVNVLEPKGNMIIDIGGGTTEIAVMAMGGIVCDKSVKVAGDVFTNDIALYMRSHEICFGIISAIKRHSANQGDRQSQFQLETYEEKQAHQERDELINRLVRYGGR